MSKENDLTVGKAESTVFHDSINLEGFTLPRLSGGQKIICKSYTFNIKDAIGDRNIELTSEQWKQLIAKTQTIEELRIEQPKYYLGDTRWVLYQYICDMNGEDYAFRCGRYALDKIMNMTGFSEDTMSGNKNESETYYGTLNLNGEKIAIVSCDCMSKKEIVILKDYKFKSYGIVDIEQKTNDIVLYFA